MIINLADSSHRGVANSTLYTAVDLGMGFGMIMAGLIAQHFSLSAIFWVNSLVCITGLLFFRFLVLGYYENHFNHEPLSS
jgi:MFS family permease